MVEKNDKIFDKSFYFWVVSLAEIQNFTICYMRLSLFKLFALKKQKFDRECRKKIHDYSTNNGSMILLIYISRFSSFCLLLLLFFRRMQN